MKKITLKNFHIYLSILLFISCLFFPACYVGENMQAQNSYELFFFGFLGIFLAAFAWCANPLFLYALAHSKKIKSIFLSASALLLALTFISYERVMRADFDFQPDITSLGWGYFLWVMSIAIFFTGQVFSFSKAPDWLVAVSVVIPLHIGGYYFNQHYYQRAESKYNLELERNVIFEKECKNSGVKVYAKVDNINGFYMNGEVYGYQKKGLSWKRISYSVSVESLVNTGYLQFGEMLNDAHHKIGKKPETMYVRYQKPSEYVEVNELVSDVSVATEYIKYPDRIDFEIVIMVIIDKKTNQNLAESKYVFDRKGMRFCGANGDNEYSPRKVIEETLQLKPQVISADSK